MGLVDVIAGVLVSCQNRVSKDRDRLLKAGIRLDNYLDGPSSTKRSCVELVVYCPLILYAYFWMEQAPYSENWILDLPLLAVRYIVMMQMITLFPCSSGPLIVTYVHMAVDLSVMWATDLVYWMVQSEADQMCYRDKLLSCTDYWWTACLGFLTLFIAYIVYASVTFSVLSFFNAQIAVKYSGLLVIPYMSCVTGMLMWVTAPVMFFWNKCLITSMMSLRISEVKELDANYTMMRLEILRTERLRTTDLVVAQSYDNLITKLQQKIGIRTNIVYMQDIHFQRAAALFQKCALLFGVLFLLSAIFYCFVFNETPVSHLLVYQFYMELIAAGSSNCITLISIAFWFGFVSDIILLLLTYGQQIVRPVNFKLYMSVLTLFLQTNILISDDRTRLYSMKAIFFLSAYEVVIHALDNVEAGLQSLFITGRQDYRELLKLWSVLLVMTAVPTYLTTIAADTMDLSPWLLFHASGNGLLLVRVCFILTECLLLWLPWKLQRWEEGLARVLTYMRIAKAFIVVGELAIYSYYRLMAPFMSGFFIVRVICNIVYFGVMAVSFYLIARITYNARNKCYILLKDMPDVHFENDNEDCAVCFSSLVEGKALPCGHAFHFDCLNKWFKVKTVCPICNKFVNSDRSDPGPSIAGGQNDPNDLQNPIIAELVQLFNRPAL